MTRTPPIVIVGRVDENGPASQAAAARSSLQPVPCLPWSAEIVPLSYGFRRVNDGFGPPGTSGILMRLD